MIKVLFFQASWCGPCKTFGPIVDKTMSQLSNVDYQKIDVDSSAELTQRYSIVSVPTIILEKNGMQVARKSGAMTQSDLTKFIESYK